MNEISPAEFWTRLRGTTPSRIGLGRHGEALPTRAVLELGAAHAAARDAVHLPLDQPALIDALRGLGLGEPSVVRSAAPDRATYLRRPDLGRRPGSGLAQAARASDLALVVADGLSARAVQEHAVGLLETLLGILPAGISIAAPVLALQARVAFGDHIGQALRAECVLVLVGERPGLSASDSLGAYLTWAPAPGTADSARNCVSNIRPPSGLSYPAAARTLADLFAGARQIGATGVLLKDAGGPSIRAE